MAMITDIEKLRPELLEKSPAELERLAAEIALAQSELARRAAVKEKEAIAQQAGDHVEAMIAGAKFLHENGLLPTRLVEALSRADGQFNPATFLRAPKAEDLVPGMRKPRTGPKRTRRVRDANGNLVPSKASLAA